MWSSVMAVVVVVHDILGVYRESLIVSRWLLVGSGRSWRVFRAVMVSSS